MDIQEKRSIFLHVDPLPKARDLLNACGMDGEFYFGLPLGLSPSGFIHWRTISSTRPRFKTYFWAASRSFSKGRDAFSISISALENRTIRSMKICFASCTSRRPSVSERAKFNLNAGLVVSF